MITTLFRYLRPMCEKFFQYVTLTPFLPKNSENTEPKRPVSLGKKAMVLVAENQPLVEMLYGFNKRTNAGERFMLNARAEGAFNKENAQNYEGEMGIHQNGWAMEGFYSKRALIPVTSFVEGPAGKRLKKPFEVSLKDVDQFFLAAIVDEDFITGNLGCCVITCWPNQLLAETVGYQRMPVILEEKDAKKWLNPDADIEELLPLLKPYPTESMEAKALFNMEG
jgi:putative SOS response-associated peptidase YedK